MNRACGNVAEIALMNPGPPKVDAGKTLTVLHPSRSAWPSSDGVAIPGKKGRPSSAQAPTTASSVPGATANTAPASAAAPRLSRRQHRPGAHEHALNAGRRGERGGRGVATERDLDARDAAVQQRGAELGDDRWIFEHDDRQHPSTAKSLEDRLLV